MNKNKIILIIGVIMVALVLVVTGTYAYWIITKSQSGSNTLIGGCLNIDMTDASAGITLEKAWPISDFEGMQLTGYTFTVTNECDEPQDYRIDLDRLVESTGQSAMSNEYLATLLDYGVPTVYSELETHETTEDGVKEKRVLAYDTVVKGSPNTHTLRLWIDEESPVTEQGTTFLSQVKISAGQGIEKYYTPEECFTFDSSTGSITAYDETCGGTDVVIPYEITPDGTTDAVAVTQIGNGAFRNKGLISVELPRTVTTIGTTAFQLNSSLEKIIFKDGLISIGQNAFAGGSSVTSRGALSTIVLPNTLTTIGNIAFRYNSLEQLIIPDSVTSLGTLISGQAFAINNLKKLKIGSGLTTIAAKSFQGNYIEELEIPNNITTIKGSAFANNNIKKISFGTGLTTIGDNAFDNIVTAITGSDYAYSVNYLKEVIIPKNVISVGISAFAGLSADATLIVQNESSISTNWGEGWNGNATPRYEPVTSE